MGFFAFGFGSGVVFTTFVFLVHFHSSEVLECQKNGGSLVIVDSSYVCAKVKEIK